MNTEELTDYRRIRKENGGFYEQKRGLIAVWGGEAVKFLNGLITNDVAKLADGAQMPAAFPNAQGRLLASVRVMKIGDRFLFETEAATAEKVYANLFRFTFAGDFFVENCSESYRFFRVINHPAAGESGTIEFQTSFGADYFVPNEAAEMFVNQLKTRGAVEISDALYEVLRVESGIPLYGVDVDETTIVPEIGDESISYNKGCYIGQEIIARIHFRGHVAKQLRGLILAEPEADDLVGCELKSPDGKNAGRITSAVFSPEFGKPIALAFVRYDYLADGTQLKAGEVTATVKSLPFIEKL